MASVWLVGDHYQYDGGQDVLSAFTTREAAEAYLKRYAEEFNTQMPWLAHRLEVTEVPLNPEA